MSGAPSVEFFEAILRLPRLVGVLFLGGMNLVLLKPNTQTYLSLESSDYLKSYLK